MKDGFEPGGREVQRSDAPFVREARGERKVVVE